MPQIFQVLRCFKCSVFQIHPTKKSNKWQCKLCGEKQSIKRHYGLGNGKECRLHVQKLNALRGQTEEKINLVCSDENNGFEDYHESNVYEQMGNKSKWLSYVEEKEVIPQEVNNSAYLENEVSYELHRKRNKGDFMKKELSKENLEYKGFKITVHDTVKRNNSIELENDVKTLVNNSTINFVTSHNKNNLLSSKERINQELIQKTSKWDKFVDIENDHKNEDEYQVDKTFFNNSHKIFECCDDSELDLILNV